MSLRHALFLIPAIPLLFLGCSSGPSTTFVAQHEPWREDEEKACLDTGAVAQSPHILMRSSLGGPSVCGAARPFEMRAASAGRVAFKPAALLRCPMVPQVERWVRETVEPASRYYFGAPVVEMTVAASYSCRPINHRNGARLSEHGYANALDISAFTLADGRRITVKAGWRGDTISRRFLRDVHGGGCRQFTTVLGPDYDGNHHDHFHFDLARRGRNGVERVCK